MAIDWIEPKINWVSTDRFNLEDFNRIRNNILWLHDRAIKFCGVFEIESMGEAVTSEADGIKVYYINAFENNVEIINKNMTNANYGNKKTFMPNVVAIDWKELNRIEKAIFYMKDIIDSQAEIIRNIPFRLGAYKEVRI